ncbi:MAG: type IV pilus modification PilV family protein [Actinomycetota bacterium]
MTRRRDEGFTLIEIAISLSVFAVVMISLTLLFDTSLETASRTRFDELGKTVAQQKLEEIRSLPYHVAQTEEAGDVDALDLYFPNLTGTSPIAGATGSYDATTDVWTFTTTQNVTEDGRDFQIATALQFVTPLDTGSLQPQAPLAGYDSDSANVDEPATNSVRAVVTVSRNIGGGQPRSVTLETVITQAEADQPSVEASGSVLGAQVTGLSFQDGDGGGGVTADILAEVARAQTAFREVAESTSQASSDPIQVVERDPVTGVSIQPEGPTTGQSSASVPNSSTGTVQSTSASIASGTYGSLNGTGVIASWDSTNPSSTSEARISAVHSLSPEGRTTVDADDVEINARNLGDPVPLQMVFIDEIEGSVEQTSTTVQARVRSVVDIEGSGGDRAVNVVATNQFNSNGTFDGILTIDSMHVDVEAVAGTTAASTVINWTVEGLRVWDPAADGGLGGYGPAYSFGMISTCGGWVDDPNLCGPARTDGKADFENPNPVVIPAAYAGTDNAGASATSLSVVAGVTVREANADAVNGISNASLSQKNILSITTRDDLADAVALQPMLLGLGDASASVSYIIHEH